MYTSTGNLSSLKLHHLEQFQNLKKSFFFSSGKKATIHNYCCTITNNHAVLFEITQLNQLEHLASKFKDLHETLHNPMLRCICWSRLK